MELNPTTLEAYNKSITKGQGSYELFLHLRKKLNNDQINDLLFLMDDYSMDSTQELTNQLSTIKRDFDWELERRTRSKRSHWDKQDINEWSRLNWLNNENWSKF